jgi:hypothetical protein
MPIYNIKTETAYNLPNAIWETFNDNYYINNKDSYFFDTNLPLSNVPSSFTNDRFLNESKILSSQNNQETFTNNRLNANPIANLIGWQDDIWKSRPGFRIKN